MAGLNKYTDKEKRERRRRNHIARDLRTPKYRQRKIDNKGRQNNFPEDFYPESD